MGEVAVEIEGLTHGYNGRTLFENVDLRIGKGERIAIIGPNGAGKSTLLRLIMNTEKPQVGKVCTAQYSRFQNQIEYLWDTLILQIILSVIKTNTV